MRKIILVVALALPLGGCNIQTLRDYLETGFSVITRALPVVAREIDQACAALNTPIDPTVPRACAVKVSKVRAAWQSACRNTALLTDNVAGNYVAKIKADMQAVSRNC